MNKKIQKILATVLCMAMASSAVACSLKGDTVYADKNEPRETTADEDEDEDVPAESEDGVVTGENGLTYPDHVPTTDEIHPEVEPGDIAGDEAVELLNSIEAEFIATAVDNYADAAILFEDPEAFGIELDSVSWGDYSAETDEEEIAKEQEWLDALYSIDYTTLEGQDFLFYEKFVYDLEMSLYMSQFTAFPYYESAFNPLTGPQNEIMFVLHVIPFTTVEEAENYIELVNDIDRYFDLMCDFEEQRVEYGYINSDDTYEAIAETFDALVEQEDDCFLYDSFADRLDGIEDLSDEDRDALIEAHDAAMHDVFFPEFQECADRMRALEGNDGQDLGASQYEGGDAYYALQFMNNSNSGLSVEDATDILESFFLPMMERYVEVMQDDTDITWALDYLNDEYSVGDTQENLDFLQETVIGVDFPEIPEHDYTLLDVPEVFEDSFSPAAYLGFHLDNFDSNIIITNNANVDSDFGVTCAHEGYPGHLYQSLYTRANAEHPYFYLVSSSGYREGWGSYAENFSYRYFNEEGTAQDMKITENLLNILLMTRWDIGINYENWTLEDCADYYNNTVMQGLTDVAPEAFADTYNLLSSDYCYAVKYGMGFLITNIIMTEMSNQFADTTMAIDIHEAYLNSMPLTFEQIEANMFEVLSEQ